MMTTVVLTNLVSLDLGDLDRVVSPA
jgi:hypothetical protein